MSKKPVKMKKDGHKSKKKDARRLFAAILCAMLALALLLPLLSSAWVSAGAVSQSDLKQQISDLKSSSSGAAAKKKEIENQLAAIRSDKAKAQQRRSLLAQELETIDAQIANTDGQIQLYTSLIGEQEVALADAQAREQAADQRFRTRARAMEEGGDISYLSVLFQASSFTDLLDRLAMVDEIVAYDNSVVESLADAREQVEVHLADLRETETGLEEQKVIQTQQRNEQAAKVREIESVITELKQDEANAQALHDAAEAEKKKLDAEIAKKEKELKAMVAKANFTTGSGYAYPVPSSYTTITSKFGYRNCPYHGWELHRGADWSAPAGTPIYAVQGGVVIISTYAPSSYGNYVMIDHGNGRTTLYAHMSSRAVQQGSVVKQGQTIGYVGSTGSSTGNHLHLELKVNGNRQDPLGMYPGVRFTIW